MQVDIQKLEQEEIGDMLSGALNDSQTVMLIEELKKYHDVEGISETKGYNLKLKYAEQDDILLETLFIFFNPEAVIEVSKQVKSETIEKVVAHFTEGTGSDKMIKRLSVTDGTLKLLSEINYKESYFDFIGESDRTEENEVDSQAWYDGCLVFGDSSTGKYYHYRHCGASCGDKGGTGGGTPINSLDSCCRAHDRCWDVFGSNDCACDKELGKCAERTVDPGWYLVGTWAYEKSCK